VHSAQKVTADATHAVLGESTTRSMMYVAMTRARDANTAYLYERATEPEYGSTPPDGSHLLRRGTSQQAGQLARIIIATGDDVPVTAHQVAVNTSRQLLPDVVGQLLDRRSKAAVTATPQYIEWRREAAKMDATMAQARTQEHVRAAGLGRNRFRDNGVEL
jgi:hypothetical protein